MASNPPTRSNQYFIPGEGISREVIQADICRYLGNDALVRPGVYQNRDGYYITAYRNLTSAMIADLKQDSARWEAERREGEARGHPAAYRSSVVHQSRQFYGPSPEGVQTGASTGAVFVPNPSGYGDPAYSHNYPPTTSGYQSGSYAYGTAVGYAPGSEPRSSSYAPYQQPDGSTYDPNAQRTDPYNSYGQTVPGGSGPAAPRGGQPAYQPRDPYGRGGYNYPPS